MSITRLINKSILDSKAYKPPLNRKDFIKLDLNESYAILDERIIQRLKDFDSFSISSYPEYQNLIPLVAKYANVPADSVSLTNGSDHAIQLLTELFFKKGDTVLIPSPMFFVFYHYLKIKEANIKDILFADKTDHFEFALDNVLDALDSSSKGLILCNPNNPLGTKISKDSVLTLLEKTRDLDIPMIVDEAFFEYSDADATQFLGEFKNLIILRTFSKAFGLAGLRLGYIIADPSIINEFNKIRLTWNVNNFAVYAGMVVLDEIPYFKDKLKEQKAIKDELKTFLESSGIQCYKTETNFLICKHPKHSEIVAKLKENKILVNDISQYPYSGNLLKNAFRISIPSREDFETLKKVLA